MNGNKAAPALKTLIAGKTNIELIKQTPPSLVLLLLPSLTSRLSNMPLSPQLAQSKLLCGNEFLF